MNYANHKRLYNIIIVSFFIIVALALVALSFAYNSIRPIIYGLCIAYIFKPMCNVYNRWFFRLFSKKLNTAKSKKLAHYLSIIATYITWGLIISVFLSFVLPKIVKSLLQIINNIPTMIATINSYITDLLENNEVFLKYFNLLSEELTKYWNQNKQDFVNMLTSLAGGMITGVINTFMFVFHVLVGFIISVYVLSGRKKLAAQSKLLIKSVFGRKASELILKEFAFADRMFSKYFIGSITDSCIVGIVCYLGCAVLKMPYGVLVSVIVGVTNIIPFFGPYIGMFPSAVIILTSSPIKAVIFIIMMIVIQQIDGNILAPKIIGSNTGLSSFWVLFAILLFGGLFGFFGMIIGVPVFAVIYDIFGKLMRFCLRKRGEHDAISSYEKEYLSEDDELSDSFIKRKIAEWTEEQRRQRKKKRNKDTAEANQDISEENGSGDTADPSFPEKTRNAKKSKPKTTEKTGMTYEDGGAPESKNVSGADTATAAPDRSNISAGSETSDIPDRSDTSDTVDTEEISDIEDEPWQISFPD